MMNKNMKKGLWMAAAFMCLSIQTSSMAAENTDGMICESLQSTVDAQKGMEEISQEEAVLQTNGDVVIEDWIYNITTEGAYIKSYQGNAASVTIPTAVNYGGTNYKIRKVGDFAFAENSTLESVVIPEEITSLGNGAFKNCTRLKEVTINGDIGDCNKNSISIASGDNSSSNYDEYSVFYNAGAESDGLTVTFGPNVTTVPAYLFATASTENGGVYAHVTSVVFSDSVTTISKYAFYRCYDMNSITFGNKITNIEGFAFASNHKVKSLELGEKVNQIGSYAFSSNISLQTIQFNDRLSQIGSYAFANCTSLETIDLPDTVVSVAKAAFRNCTSLKEITINSDIGDCNENSAYYNPNGDSSLNYEYNSVFYNAGANSDSLTVTFGAEVTVVPAYLFATAASKQDGTYAHITSVIFSDRVKIISKYAFYNCYDLDSITFGSEVNEIGIFAFANNSKLKSIDLSGKVSLIDSYAFSNNSSLQTIKFGKELSQIGSYAFVGCTELESIDLPKSLVSVDKAAFKNCTNLNEIVINGDIKDCKENSAYFDPSGDASLNYDFYSVFCNAGANSDSLTVTFGAEVTTVPAYLFATGAAKADGTYAHVTSVVFPEGVKTINNYAFYNCYDLESITFGKKLTAIGASAFANCNKLTRVDLSKTVNSIGKDAFTASDRLVIYAPWGSSSAAYAKENNIQLVEVVFVEDKYADVKEGAWYVPAVQYAYDTGLMIGLTDTTFGTENKLTRAQFVTVLYSNAGKPEVSYQPIFADVKEGQWYSLAVIWAQENGVVSGVGADKFGTDNYITREQLALMMYKYAENKEINTSITDGVLDDFSDKTKVSSWAQEAVQWAVSHGILSGKPGANETVKLDPSGYATRAECAAMMKKMLTMN